MPIPFYRCNKCKREHPNVEAAIACERAHLIPEAVLVKPYLYSVEITFTNGEKRIYNSKDLGG